jgi:hypothetical protein
MLKPVCSICLAVQRRKITPKPRTILRGRGRGTGQANIPHRLATTKAAFATRRALAAAIIILSPLLVHSVRGASNNRRSAAFTLPALGLQVGKTATSARRLAALNNPAALEIMSFQKVFDKDLFVSEPNPAWFGNPPNEPNPAWTNANWLKSRFHFSFAEYNNAKNSNFGVLRVTNDDLVQPSRGFGEARRAENPRTYLSLISSFDLSCSRQPCPVRASFSARTLLREWCTPDRSLGRCDPGAHPHREMEIVTYIVEVGYDVDDHVPTHVPPSLSRPPSPQFGSAHVQPTPPICEM